MDEVRSGIAAVAQDQSVAVAVQASDGETASERFWEPIRARLISFRNLSVPLRVLLVLVVALVIAGAVMLGTLGLHQPMIAVTVDQGQAVQLPVSIFALTIITFLLAWALLIAGSIRSFWLVRFLILGAFTFTTSKALASDQYLVAQIAALAALWLYALGITLVAWRKRRSQPPGVRMSLHADRTAAVAFGLALLVQVIVYICNWLWVQQSAELFWAWVGVSLADQLGSNFVWLLVAAAFVTGTDFAEWGDVLFGRVAALAGKARSPWPLAIVACVLAMVFLVIALRWEYTIGPSLGATALHIVPPIALVLFVALLLAGIYRVARMRQWATRAAPSLGVTVAGLALLGIMVVVSQTIAPSLQAATPPANRGAPSGYSYFTHQDSAPFFSIAYPNGWNVKVVQDLGPTQPTVMTLVSSASGLDFSVVAVPASDLDTHNITSDEAILQTVFTDLDVPAEPPVFVPAASSGDWRSWRFEYAVTPNDPAPLEGEVWLQRHDDQVWVLYGLARNGTFAAGLPTFTTMLSSWLFFPPPPSTSGAPAADYSTTNIVLGLGILALGMLIGLPLLLLGRKRGSALPALGLFVVLIGVQQVCLYLPTILSPLQVPSDWVPQFAPSDIVLTVSLAILVYTAWSLVRGRLRSPSSAATATLARLLTLAGAMFVVTVIYVYYSASSTLGPQQAPLLSILLALAFLWDLLTSGEQVTNRESAMFPRAACVLLYLGYTLLVTCCVLYFSSLFFRSGVADTSYASAFNPDYWAQTGLLMLGSPLLLTGFLLGSARPAPARSAPATAPALSPF